MDDMTGGHETVNLLYAPGSEPEPANTVTRLARWRYRLKIGWRDPTATIGVLMVLLFAYLIVVPIVTLLHDSVEVQFGDERRTKSALGDWTLYYFTRALSSPVANDLFWDPLRNTLSIAVVVIMISITIGGVLAWLLSRTDMFGRRWFARSCPKKPATRSAGKAMFWFTAGAGGAGRPCWSRSIST